MSESPTTVSPADADYESYEAVVRPLGVSNYDRTASSLVAALIIIGFFVLLLLILFLSSRVLASRAPVNVEMLEDFGGRAANPLGTAQDFNPPGVEELDLVEPQTTDALAAITDAISAQAASLNALDGDTASVGSGAGDSRQAGPGGNSDILPPWERWRIEFDATTTNSYAKQLDFFGIELAAIQSNKSRIEYATAFSTNRPQRRVGNWNQEERIYMSWLEGKLRNTDRSLVSRAGISARGKMIVQFYPKPVYQQLLQTEHAALGSKKLRQVKRTYFGVRAGGPGYEFYVIRQEFR